MFMTHLDFSPHLARPSDLKRGRIFQMRNKRKNKQKKKRDAGSSSKAPQNAVASTSANSGNSLREEARDGVILGLNFVKDLSDSTDLLSPLKAATGVVIRVLETARV